LARSGSRDHGHRRNNRGSIISTKVKIKPRSNPRHFCFCKPRSRQMALTGGCAQNAPMSNLMRSRA
jgi:hypothetical protein